MRVFKILEVGTKIKRGVGSPLIKQQNYKFYNPTVS